MKQSGWFLAVMLSSSLASAGPEMAPDPNDPNLALWLDASTLAAAQPPAPGRGLPPSALGDDRHQRVLVLDEGRDPVDEPPRVDPVASPN